MNEHNERVRNNQGPFLYFMHYQRPYEYPTCHEEDKEDDTVIFEEAYGHLKEIMYENVTTWYREPIKDHLDLRDGRYVSTKVGHQGRCNACWAFVVAGLLESVLAGIYKKYLKDPKAFTISHPELGKFFDAMDPSSIIEEYFIKIAEQELIECSPSSENEAQQKDKCGRPNYVKNILRVAQIRGLYTESGYGKFLDHGLRNCRRHQVDQNHYIHFIPHIHRSVLYLEHFEVEIKVALQRYLLPVAANLLLLPDVNRKYYHLGVYNYDVSARDILDPVHAVLIVGFGTEIVGTRHVPYWLIKNSYSEAWGDKGFGKVERTEGRNLIFYKKIYRVTPWV